MLYRSGSSTRRAIVFGLCIPALMCVAVQQPAVREVKRSRMTPQPPRDQVRLQAWFEVHSKYTPVPVPTPLDRAAAIAFVNEHVTTDTPPERLRKLMRLAVFYDLQETGPAFLTVMNKVPAQPGDMRAAAACIIALAWIGTPGQKTAARQFYHALQERADPERDRKIMLEITEAFGPFEGTASHRQWVEAGIHRLEGQLQQERATNNVRGIKLIQEKIKVLTEYIGVQLALVERGFGFRTRIDSSPETVQVQPLTAFAIAALPESTPELNWWASMKLLRLAPALHGQIAAEFLRQAGTLTQPDKELYRERSLRAAQYFGNPLSETERAWLQTQPDPLVDPLVLRPGRELTLQRPDPEPREDAA
jgi:hypothetical protein